MTTRVSVFLALFLVAVLASAQAEAQVVGDAARGAKLGYTCLGCHGIPNYNNVNPVYPVPKLGGQHPEYLVVALTAYKNGERAHGTMHAQASSMNEQDMADVAAFLAGTVIKAPATPAPVKPAPQAAATCTACHGTDGVGIVAEYPTLSGQHREYLERALTDYKKGNRKNPIMAGFAGSLSAEDIKALAAYYSQQTPSLYTSKRR
jgi:cytochrome c553